jgi:PKD repeat protein
LGGSSTFVNESTGSPTSYLWTFQDATPATSTLQNPTVLTWNAPGRKNVSLQVTNVNGSNTLTKTGYVKVGEVGFKELNQNSVSVFPNPANDFVTVQSMNTIKNIQVYNLAGQLVFEQTANAKFVTVKTFSLSAGVYNLKATLENSTVNKKIVIN